MAKLFGIQHIKTVSYHPISNGMVERFHRTLKAALKCSTQPWTDALPMVMLGLRNTYKDELQASPAEMIYGTTLRIPGDFCVPRTPITEKSVFVRKLRQLFRDIKPVPASRHSSKKPFVYKDLPSCTHVFKRIDRIRKPLEPPYSGPHRIINRINERTYNIEIDGEAKVVSTDQLKPAYLEHQDAAAPAEQPLQDAAVPAAVPAEQPAEDLVSTSASRRPRQKVSFTRSQNLLTGKGVAVAAAPEARATRRSPRRAASAEARAGRK
uniref:Integrase catalytic domain-containing protein n=1 Tax=Trichogramma kaykai TaxID=54128 RepID=A0ABD2WBM0_9HYME